MIKEMLSYIVSDNSILLSVVSSALGVVSVALTLFWEIRYLKDEKSKRHEPRRIEETQILRTSQQNITCRIPEEKIISGFETIGSNPMSKRFISSDTVSMAEDAELDDTQKKRDQEYRRLLFLLRSQMSSGSLSDHDIQSIMQMIESKQQKQASELIDDGTSNDSK